jgi:hypothetical protein
MADYTIINTTPSTLNIRTIYDNTITGFSDGQNAILQYSDVKMEFFVGTARTNYLPYRTNTSYYFPWWGTDSGNIAEGFVANMVGLAYPRFPCIGRIISNTTANEGFVAAGWLAIHPQQQSYTNPDRKLSIKITPQNNKTITGYTLYYQDQLVESGSIRIETGQNATQHDYQRLYGGGTTAPANWSYIGSYEGYAKVFSYTKDLSTNPITSTDFLYVNIDAAEDDFSADAGTIKMVLNTSLPPANTPTPLTFVNNTLTVTNDISSTDVDMVSFQLPAGSRMYSFNVTSLLNANSINYSLEISGGANVSSGTITSTGVNLLGGNNLTPAVDTTYILTLTSGSTNTYTIIGKCIFPWNSISNSNAFGKSYVNNFIDLRGDLLIRNDGAVIVGGDVSFNNITVAGSTTFAGDTTFKSRLFIGNDISVNGNLYVGGDLSVNGIFSGDFASGIIPTSAIIDYPSSGSNVEITGNVRVAGDASFNGTRVDLSTNTILQVSGNITFTDGTTLSTYVNDISSGSFAEGNVIFKPSTFASVTCNGNVSAGSKLTSSDYRLKTNVTDLNQSYTVDNLVPIQYNNILSNKHEFGLIAHELQAVYPELVKGEKDGAEYQHVNYNGLIGVLVKEVQELNRRRDDLCKKQ